jgi:hypothetical protein
MVSRFKSMRRHSGEAASKVEKTLRGTNVVIFTPEHFHCDKLYSHFQQRNKGTQQPSHFFRSVQSVSHRLHSMVTFFCKYPLRLVQPDRSPQAAIVMCHSPINYRPYMVVIQDDSCSHCIRLSDYTKWWLLAVRHRFLFSDINAP